MNKKDLILPKHFHYEIPQYFPLLTKEQNDFLQNDIIKKLEVGDGEFQLKYPKFDFIVKGNYWAIHYVDHDFEESYILNSKGHSHGLTLEQTYDVLNNEFKPNSDMFNSDGTWKKDEENYQPLNYKDAGTILTQLERPKRYASREVNGMDVIDLVKHWNLNFNEGNILKYLLRDKGEDISDMEKIIDYAQRELKYLENETSNKKD